MEPDRGPRPVWTGHATVLENRYQLTPGCRQARSTPSIEELVIPVKERKSIQTLSECSCRWPIGDPQMADFHFCGKNKVPGLPYCEFHARRAFQPPQPRRREREIVEPRIPALATPAQPGKEPADA